jgi:hypothetical protein
MVNKGIFHFKLNKRAMKKLKKEVVTKTEED